MSALFESTPHAIELALAFAEAFPVTEDPDEPTIVTAYALDKFFEEHDGGYTLEEDDHSYVVVRRNQLRQKINRVARGPVWQTVSNRPPFKISVRNWGQDYLVLPTGEAFEHDALVLPNQVASFVNTKRKNLKSLRNSIDGVTLPESLQIRIEMLGDRIDDFAATVDFHADRINADVREIQQKVAEFISSEKKKITSA